MNFLIGLLLLVAGAVANAQNHQCVTNCMQRDYKGQCVQYGDNYCGEKAKCVKHCIVRSAINEQCMTYAPDFCGSNATCTTRCVDSYNGYCNQCGEDHCYESRALWPW